MWFSEQQKRTARGKGGQTGIVTMAGDSLAVRLESEVRSPELYGPAGYRWEPKAGDRVLVIKGEEETPCIVGVKQGSIPACVDIRAETVQIQGAILVNGTLLEDYVAALVKRVMEGTE